VHNADPGRHGEEVLSSESRLSGRIRHNRYLVSTALGQIRLHQPTLGPSVDWALARDFKRRYNV
jgi:hypothetical protein